MVAQGEAVSVEDGKFNVLFRREMMSSDSDLLKYDSVKELLNYVNNKDAEIEKVKVLITRANRKLRPLGKQLYVRKAHSSDREAENRICMTRI